MPMYSEERSGEVHRHRHPHGGLALEDPRAGAGEQAKHSVHVAVRQHRGAGAGVEAGVLEDVQGARDAVLRILATRGEEFAAVGVDRQFGVVGTLVDEPEERQDPGPCGVGVGQAPSSGLAAVQLLDQPGQAVVPVVDCVVAGQELARLREQHHHRAHGHATGSPVDVGMGHSVLPFGEFLQRLAVALNQDLHRLAHPLAEHRGQLGLPLAGLADRVQQRAGDPLLLGRPDRRTQQRPQRGRLRCQPPLLEPEFGVPVARGVVVQSREDETPVAAVGDQSEMLAPSAQPPQYPAHDSAAPTDADARGIVDEDREGGAVRSAPQLARLHHLAGDRTPSLRPRNPAAPAPLARGAVESAHLLEDEGHELGSARRLTVAVRPIENWRRPPSQLPLGVPVEPPRDVPGQRFESRAVQQEAVVSQLGPAWDR